MRRTLVTLILLLGLAACGAPVEKDGGASPTAFPAGKGTPLPAFSMQSADGGKVEFQPGAGPTLTVVEVWSPTWFEGADAQFQGLQEIHERWGNRGVRVLCIAYDVATDTVRAAIEEHGALFDVGLGEPAVYEALGVEAIPTTWILDRHGRVVSKTEGYQPVPALERELGKLLTPP